MTNPFYSTHPSNQLELDQALHLGENLLSYASQFIEAFKLSHVWVSKYYFDGRYIDICSDFSWKTVMTTNNFYKNYIQLFLGNLEANNVLSKPTFLSWQTENLEKDPLIQKVEDHNIQSHINFFFIQDDHIESYGFGSLDHILNMSKGLLNSREVELFCLYLREKVFSQINNPQALSGFAGQEFQRPSIKSQYTHTPVPDYFEFTCNDHTSSLSRREFESLCLLARGYDQKDIAQIMGLSPRTIEFHLQKIKTKYLLPSKRRLITDFYQSPLAMIDPSLLRK